MAATIDGMPLVYNGQESGLDKRLEFFEKDTINWKEYKFQDFYATLFDLKDRNGALWNGQYGGDFEPLSTTTDRLYAYRRVKGDEEVLVVLNFSGTTQDVKFRDFKSSADYTNVFAPNNNIQLPDEGLKLGEHTDFWCSKSNKNQALKISYLGKFPAVRQPADAGGDEYFAENPTD